MEITECLNKYSDCYYEDMFGSSYNKKTTDGLSRASKFLSDFALSAYEYQQECVPIMEKVFKSLKTGEFKIRTSPVSMLFQPDYETTLHIFSPMFTEDSYHYIQKICQACGDSYFYIVEDSDEDAAFQLKIPATTSWEQLQSGGFISAVLFNMPYNNYRIFGDSCSWGIWCDYENSWADYEIFGSKPDIQEIRNYNQQMALSVEDYSYMQNHTDFPQTIRIASGTNLSEIKLTDDRRDVKSKCNELTLYVK